MARVSWIAASAQVGRAERDSYETEMTFFLPFFQARKKNLEKTNSLFSDISGKLLLIFKKQ